MNKILLITIMTVLVGIVFIYYGQSDSITDGVSDYFSTKEIFSDSQIGVSFEYNSDWGEPLVQSTFQNCIDKDHYLEKGGPEYYNLYKEQIDIFADKECIKYEIFFGTETPNQNLADVYIVAMNSNQKLQDALPKIGKGGADNPLPLTETFDKDLVCPVPGVAQHTDGTCNYVTKNGTLMRHTTLTIREAISDVPRYEYSFYIPKTDLGVMIKAGSVKSSAAKQMVEQIVDSIELI